MNIEYEEITVDKKNYIYSGAKSFDILSWK